MIRRLLLALGALLFAAPAMGEADLGAPAMPYYDWGACPFECCVYRQWTAEAPVPLRPAVGTMRPVVEMLAKGERVQALTGVVVTRRAGRVRMLRAATLDPANPVAVRPGDTLYTLHARGEGVDLFWFKGHVHAHELLASAPDSVGRPGKEWQVLSIPETEWWVQIRTASGRLGWSNEPDKFLGKDACG